MKVQEIDEKFDPIELIRRLHQENVKFMLIGATAIAMHGANLGSMDYDFWILGEDRMKVYAVLRSFGLSGNPDPNHIEPINVFMNEDGDKVDTFFMRSFVNEEKKMEIRFDDVYDRSVVKADPNSDFHVRIPAIEDLIAMKMVLSELRPQHIKQIEYLEALRGDKDTDLASDDGLKL